MFFLFYIFPFFNVSQNRRYFQLNNGSLLIINANSNDKQNFTCTAFNQYSAKSPQSHSIKLNILSKTNSSNYFIRNKLLPPLQNQSSIIAEGNVLRLLCAASQASIVEESMIEWTFIPRNHSIKKKLQLNSVELKIENLSSEKDDGIYECSVNDDHQVGSSRHS